MVIRRTPKIYTFYHDQHPTFIGTLDQFRLAYPEMSISQITRLTSKDVKNSGGWRRTPENLAMNRVANTTTTHIWYSSKGGVFTGNIIELIDSFPDEKLFISNLYAVVLGEAGHHHGWSLTPENCVTYKKHTWVNDQLGITEHLCAYEMKEKYPYLHASSLSYVVNKKYKSTYGWRIVK